MFLLVTRNWLRSHRGNVMTINRGSKFRVKGIIPGGGLKLQGMKEEEYFSRQDNELFKKMKQYSEDTNSTKEVQKLRPYESTYSVKHKDVLEEAYFLNDHCDSLRLLKSKLKPKK